jgi:hypothetical protein
MLITEYTISQLCDIFEMSRQYFYRLVKEGKGPVLSGDGTHPVIKLTDALVFGRESPRYLGEL